MKKSLIFFLGLNLLPVRAADPAPWWPAPVTAALSNSAGNLAELTRALLEVPEAQREGMKFLIENMPAVDAQGGFSPESRRGDLQSHGWCALD